MLKGSEGNFPSCICGNNKVYVPERDACVEINRSICPVGSKKVNNKCVCETVNEFKYEFDDIFWICRPWYLPTSTTTTPKPCPAHQHRVGDVCEWDHCPVGYLSKTGALFKYVDFWIYLISFHRENNHRCFAITRKLIILTFTNNKVSGRIVQRSQLATIKE